MRCLTVLCGVLMLTATGGNAAAQSKGDVKVAIIYNILRFVTFPNNTATLTVCARRQDSLVEGLKSLEGRAVSTRKITVAVYDKIDQAANECDVVYVGYASARTLQKPARGQILIGEDPSFVDQGGTVGLVSFGPQVRFTINARVAQSSGVRFSSQLMQLAAKVIS
ncbi:YfiR family protein [Sphingobium sp. DEHP117]|uniref:YfiR family protein n=1 Tax=Sphingobium sp. DEHP117 TaxID=2993436 RepID=UPI0027D60CDC|nr:YfiR/HmsC family protein [Sphingobium sp. DEHP117]MDQ4421003.1 YfiR family protein [Sphingobium sp. DEHP117]